MLKNLHKTWNEETEKSLNKLHKAAANNANIFEEMVHAAKYASIGQITDALFTVGGQYRRNM